MKTGNVDKDEEKGQTGKGMGIWVDKEREVEHKGKRMKWGREYSNAEEKK